MTHNGKPVYIFYRDFPENVKDCRGFAIEVESCYRIAIDNNNAAIQKRFVLGHELAHVYLNHSRQPDKPTAQREREANSKAWYYYRLYKAGALENGEEADRKNISN